MTGLVLALVGLGFALVGLHGLDRSRHDVVTALTAPVDQIHADSVVAVRNIRAESARLRTIAASWSPRPYPRKVTR